MIGVRLYGYTVIRLYDYKDAIIRSKDEDEDEDEDGNGDFRI